MVGHFEEIEMGYCSGLELESSTLAITSLPVSRAGAVSHIAIGGPLNTYKRIVVKDSAVNAVCGVRDEASRMNGQCSFAMKITSSGIVADD